MGTSVRVTTGRSRYAFVRWVEGGKGSQRIDLGFLFIPLSYINTSEYSFTLEKDRELVAEFAKVYPIDVKVSGKGSVKTLSDRAVMGQKSTIFAVPAKGYLFDRWTEGDREYQGDVFKFWGDRHLKLTAHFVRAVQIDAVAEPAKGGTVKGGGTYKKGAVVTLKATPASNYEFAGWYEDGEKVGDDQKYILEADKDRRLTARFEPYVEITALAKPQKGGRVWGAGFYKKGDEVVLTAAPASGYEFAGWLRDGAIVGDNTACYAFTAEVSCAVEALFEEVGTYTVDLDISPSKNAGNVSGGGTFNKGTPVTVFAIPEVNYRFKNWTEDGAEVSKEMEYSFDLNSDRELTANFYEIYYLGLSAEPEEGGQVVGRGYHEAGGVTVQALPSYGYRFDRWVEDERELSGSEEYEYNLETNTALVAHFVKAHQVTIAYDEFVGGSYTGEGTYDVGDGVTVTATPFDGYVFVKWLRDGAKVSEAAEYSFTMPDEPVNLVAVFLPLYDIVAGASPAAAGTVSGEGIYVRGDSVTVTAAANAGYDFYRWEENGDVVSNSASYTFTAEKDRTLTAVFRALRTITLESEPAGWGRSPPTEIPATKQHPGAELKITATPGSGYIFKQWTLDGALFTNSRVHTFTVGSSDLHLVAVFDEWPRHEITVESANPAWGTVSGGEIYDEDSQATVTASPKPGYYFVRWLEAGSQVSTSATYTFTVTGPRHLVAEFREPVVTAKSNNTSYGKVSIVHPRGTTAQGSPVNVSVAPGSNVTLKAHRVGENTFEKWKENGSTISTNTDHTVSNITTDRVFEAEFKKKSNTCPFVYSYNEDGYHFENEAIPQSASKALEDTYYGSLHKLREVDGKYRVQIAEMLQEKSYVNWFKLYAVDYPADSGVAEVIADMHGYPHTIEERVKPTSFYDHQGNSWLREVTTKDQTFQSDSSGFYEGTPVVTYEAEFPLNGANPKEARLMLDLQASKTATDCWAWFMDVVDGKNNQWWIDEILNRDSVKEQFVVFTDIVALRVELWNGTSWELVDLVRPGGAVMQEYVLPIDLDSVNSGEDVLKVRFRGGAGFFVFDTVTMDFSENKITAITELRPETALLNGEKDVLEELSRESEQRVRILHGEAVDLVYSAPELSESNERGFMIALRGYYHTHPEAVENPTVNYWNELSAGEIIGRVLKTIPGAVKVMTKLFKMYRLMTSVNGLTFEERVSKIMVDHILPWMEQQETE